MFYGTAASIKGRDRLEVLYSTCIFSYSNFKSSFKILKCSYTKFHFRECVISQLLMERGTECSKKIYTSKKIMAASKCRNASEYRLAKELMIKAQCEPQSRKTHIK